MYSLRSAIPAAVILAVCGGASSSFALPPVLGMDAGGTGCTTAACALAAIGGTERGVNHTLTDIEGLVVPLNLSEGGSAATTAAGARTNFHAAEYPINNDLSEINSLRHAKIFQDNAGSSTEDNAIFEVKNTTRTAASIYRIPFPPNTPSWFFSDMIRIVEEIDPGSTTQGVQGLGFYGVNNVAQNRDPLDPLALGTRRNMVGDFCVIYAKAASSFSWCANYALTDRIFADLNNSSNDITVPAVLLGLEIDAGSHNTGSQFAGIGAILTGYAQPASAGAYQVTAASNKAQWSVGFTVNAGAIQHHGAFNGDAIIVGAQDAPGDVVLGQGSPSNAIALGISDTSAVLDDEAPNHLQPIGNPGLGDCVAGLYTLVGGTIAPFSGSAATVQGTVTNGIIDSLVTVNKGLYTVPPPMPAGLSGTNCTGAPSINGQFVGRGHFLEMRGITSGINSGFKIQDNLTGSGIGFGFNPSNMFIVPASLGNGSPVNIVLSPVDGTTTNGNVAMPSVLPLAGLVVADSFGNIKEASTFTAAAHPQNFVASNWIPVSFNGQIKFIPLSDVEY